MPHSKDRVTLLLCHAEGQECGGLERADPGSSKRKTLEASPSGSRLPDLVEEATVPLTLLHC